MGFQARLLHPVVGNPVCLVCRRYFKIHGAACAAYHIGAQGQPFSAVPGPGATGYSYAFTVDGR
jgi:hypothetical protein